MMQAFGASTLRDSFLFERVETQTADTQGGEITSEVSHVLHGADPVPGRGEDGGGDGGKTIRQGKLKMFE